MDDELYQCQLYGLPAVLEPFTFKDLPMHIIRRIMHFTLKRINYINQVRSKTQHSFLRKANRNSSMISLKLQSGDRVRVKSYEEISSTLNDWGKLKGCGFMGGMKQYCGTEQRVHKRVERFLDERDYHLKKCNGIVILEGVQCTGVMGFGRCDRSCYFFWRVEWLEKIG